MLVVRVRSERSEHLPVALLTGEGLAGVWGAGRGEVEANPVSAAGGRAAVRRDLTELPAGVPVGAWGFPKVTGKCPACGCAALFLAVGGYVTCANIPCPNPTSVAESLNGSA